MDHFLSMLSEVVPSARILEHEGEKTILLQKSL